MAQKQVHSNFSLGPVSIKSYCKANAKPGIKAYINSTEKQVCVFLNSKDDTPL